MLSQKLAGHHRSKCKRGGMDGEGFKKCVQTNVLELHPDAADVPGKQAMIKVDGGPGRLNGQMLSMLCSQGFHPHSCVPNWTAVRQETDHNHGTFKSVCRGNLRKIAKD